MKKTTWYIIGVIVLVLIAVMFYLQDEKNTLDPSLSDFSLAKNAHPDSIVLTQDSLVTRLSLRDGRWVLNSALDARQNAVQHLFNVFRRLQVESPATEDSKKIILELIKQNPIHVKIFEDQVKLKDYYIEESPNKQGPTYMLMSGSKEPFLMNLPGFEGDIASLYRADPDYWRNRMLFDYSGIDISKVEIYYPENKENSFKLIYNEKDKFVLRKAYTNENVESFNTSKAARYLSYFSNIRYDSLADRSAQLKDSLLKTDPYCIIKTHDVNGGSRTLKTYRKRAKGERDAFGQSSYYDLNYLYGLYNDFGEILLIKYTEIDPLFKEIDYFRVE
jgi:hypothetical protein